MVGSGFFVAPSLVEMADPSPCLWWPLQEDWPEQGHQAPRFSLLNG